MYREKAETTQWPLLPLPGHCCFAACSMVEYATACVSEACWQGSWCVLRAALCQPCQFAKSWHLGSIDAVAAGHAGHAVGLRGFNLKVCCVCGTLLAAAGAGAGTRDSPASVTDYVPSESDVGGWFDDVSRAKRIYASKQTAAPPASGGAGQEQQRPRRLPDVVTQATSSSSSRSRTATASSLQGAILSQNGGNSTGRGCCSSSSSGR
jgi:hypothetical protein